MLAGHRFAVSAPLGLLCWVALLTLVPGQIGAAPLPAGGSSPASAEQWRGVHLMATGHDDVPALMRAIREGLAPIGVNVIVLQVGHVFDFESHPEMGPEANALTREDARRISAVCHELDIRLIPEFNCLGHQSWRGIPGALLTHHPDMSETPGIPQDQHLSWCPRHPGVNAIVFDLLDELASAFESDALHVGMDEVFIIASEHCPRCRGADPAEVFAEAVNDLHRHVVVDRGLTMLMWGDRLIDAEATGYPEWEASANGTWPAIEMIPTDIIICDWHYSAIESYPSMVTFQERGFRVWPTSWKDAHAASALIRFSEAHGQGDLMLGHLCTTWCGRDLLVAILPGSDTSGLDPEAVQAADTVRHCMRLLTER